jgi:hypothetical protein
MTSLPLTAESNDTYVIGRSKLEAQHGGYKRGRSRTQNAVIISIDLNCFSVADFSEAFKLGTSTEVDAEFLRRVNE